MNRKKIITLHSYSSNGIGGIETLIRSLQKIANDIDFDAEEIFAEEGIANLFKTEYPNVKKTKLPNLLGSSISKRILRVLTWRKIIKKRNLKNNIIIIFSAGSLIYFSRKELKENIFLYVQTSKFEKLFNSKIKKLFFNLHKRYIKSVVVYTDYDKKKFLKLHDNISVIPRGCKIDKSDRLANYSYKLITIARIDEKSKNLSEMIEIVKSLPDYYELYIYGDGESNEIKNLKDMIKNEDKIKFLGPTKDVKEVLKECSLFLMTSHYEGFGQTLIEARSQGLPIVLYNTFDSAQWIVKNGFNGYLVSPYDKEEFKKSIMKITKDEETYKKYSKNALFLADETDNNVIEKKWKDLILSFN